MRAPRTWQAKSTLGAMSNAYAAHELDGDASTLQYQDVPDSAELGVIEAHLDTIAGGATTITWYISRDAAGDIALTPKRTDTIETNQTATKGSVVVALGIPYRRSSVASVKGKLYVWAKLDAGTANLQLILTGTNQG